MRLKSVKDLADWSHGGLLTHQSDVRARVTLHPLRHTHNQARSFIQCTLVSVVPDVHDSLQE